MATNPSLKSLLGNDLGIDALVFDMDGVLLDTVGADLQLCQQAAQAVIGDGSWLKREAIIANFALEPESFWGVLKKDAPQEISSDELKKIVRKYNDLREVTEFELIPGAVELLKAAEGANLKLAVASSNDVQIVRSMLDKAGILDRFHAIAGIEEGGSNPKPAPDIYEAAASQLGVAPSRCAFVEDSVTGLTAGRAAKYGYALGVATGATSFSDLEKSGLADQVFDRFDVPSLEFFAGAPTNKNIDTPNDFVSHMLEHIAWRLGVGIDLRWRSNDWTALGRFIGENIRGLDLKGTSSATLGMIDDGAAECLVDLSKSSELKLSAHHSLNLERILNMRVEQVDQGQELVDLLKGLAEGLDALIDMRICTFEDPHHSWEGVYRALGICLNRLRLPA